METVGQAKVGNLLLNFEFDRAESIGDGANGESRELQHPKSEGDGKFQQIVLRKSTATSAALGVLKVGLHHTLAGIKPRISAPGPTSAVWSRY